MTPLVDVSDILVKPNPFTEICMHCPKRDCTCKSERDCEIYVPKAYSLIQQGIRPKPGTLEAEDPDFVEKMIKAYETLPERLEHYHNRNSRRYQEQKKRKETNKNV